jgi:hypothetical protein
MQVRESNATCRKAKQSRHDQRVAKENEEIGGALHLDLPKGETTITSS